MRADWVLYSAPAVEPLTVAVAKSHCRVSDDSENHVILTYLKASRQDAEAFLGRGLLTQTWKLVLDDFADTIWLPMAAPLQSVSSVTYYDGNGVLQTLASSVYTVHTASEPGRLTLGVNQAWPAVQSERGSAITITYVVGWTAEELVPEHIVNGIALLTSARYERLTGPAWEASVKAAESSWQLAGRVYWKAPEYCRPWRRPWRVHEAY